MAAEDLLEAMDHLWFHHIILLSKPSSLHSHQDSKKTEQDSNNTSQTSLISEQEDIFLEEISSEEESVVKERPTRLILLASKARCHSSSPISSQRKSRNLGILHKIMSCKTLIELELEEVKGFMDLGFIFPKENLSTNITNLLPGLQRINNDDDDDDDERECVMRPYLSESWIIKRPDSPLLNLRIPRISTTEDMKKHLKNWAQTVASTIQQDS